MKHLSRRQFLEGIAAVSAVSALGLQEGRSATRSFDGRLPLGVVIHSYGVRSKAPDGKISDPMAFVEHCRQLGAAGVQTSLGIRDDAFIDRLRSILKAAEMFFEGIVRLPKSPQDADRFEAELRSAQAAGATVVRTVLLDSRRYETFDSLAAFREFSKSCDERLRWAKPIAERVQIKLAVENHKDWRADDLLAIIRRADSANIGVCLDTGNSISLLEEPHEVVEALAPVTLTTHFKDMAVAEFEQGFLLSEVPLGTGILDLPRIVELLRQQQREIRLNLEMITRDPLQVPCLTPGYWTTFPDLPARDLARTLELVKRRQTPDTLPRIAGMTPAQQIDLEEANVRECFHWGRQHLAERKD